jgi:hypothetical protein
LGLFCGLGRLVYRSPLGTCKGLLEGFELTGQGSDFFRQSSRFKLTGRDRLLKALQLIDGLLLGRLQITDRLGGRIWCGCSYGRIALLHGDGFVNAQDRHQRNG